MCFDDSLFVRGVEQFRSLSLLNAFKSKSELVLSFNPRHFLIRVESRANEFATPLRVLMVFRFHVKRALSDILIVDDSLVESI